MGNVFALLGLRALFVLVESLIARFRYLDETIAIVLGLVGVKLLDRGLCEGRPGGEPRPVIAVAFTIGIGLSMRADRRDPDADEHREERVEAMHRSHHLADAEHSDGAASEPARERQHEALGGHAAAARQLALERCQAVVPLGADLGHPLERLGHRPGCGAVEHLAARAARGDEPGVRRASRGASAPPGG